MKGKYNGSRMTIYGAILPGTIAIAREAVRHPMSNIVRPNISAGGLLSLNNLKTAYLSQFSPAVLPAGINHPGFGKLHGRKFGNRGYIQFFSDQPLYRADFSLL